MAAALPIITLVGAGVSAYSAYSQGQAQKRIAQFNYAVQSSNARLNQMSQLAALQQAQAQSAIAMRQAEINAQMANQEAAARERNARLIRQTADAELADSREAIRRKRLEYARFQATQRNRIAASGVVAEAGSPLEMLAETAGEMQVALETMRQGADINFQTRRNEAEMELFGARLARAGNASQLSVARAGNRIERATFGLRDAGIRAGYQADMSAARIARIGSFNDAAGTQMAAAGTLLQGAGNYASQNYNFTYTGVR